jgi:hypothetical protein
MNAFIKGMERRRQYHLVELYNEQNQESTPPVWIDLLEFFLAAGPSYLGRV